MQPAALSTQSVGVMQQVVLAACIIFKYFHATESGAMQFGVIMLSVIAPLIIPCCTLCHNHYHDGHSVVNFIITPNLTQRLQWRTAPVAILVVS